MKKIRIKLQLIWITIKSAGRAFRRESKETVIASRILLKLAKGKEVTPEQIKFLKEQSIDFGKSLTLIGLQFVPGSSLAIIAIEKAGKKHGFSMFPKDQHDPDVFENKDEKKP